MICYLETSAVIPMLIREPSTATCRQLWELADDVASSQLTFVECAAALAAAQRSGRIDVAGHRAALTGLDRLWAELDALPVDESLLAEAALLAAAQALKGYDAVHCASALLIAGPDLVAASGDRRLLEAWSRMGVEVIDTNQITA